MFFYLQVGVFNIYGCPYRVQTSSPQLPLGMPGISLVTVVPGTAVAKDIQSWDIIYPGFARMSDDYGKRY